MSATKKVAILIGKPKQPKPPKAPAGYEWKCRYCNRHTWKRGTKVKEYRKFWCRKCGGSVLHDLVRSK